MATIEVKHNDPYLDAVDPEDGEIRKPFLVGNHNDGHSIKMNSPRLAGRTDPDLGEMQEIEAIAPLHLDDETLWIDLSRLVAAENIIADGDKGDITLSNIGTVWTVDNGAITNAKLADMPSGTFKLRASAGAGSPENGTPAQATSLLDVFTTLLKGVVPPSGGGTANFLRADGAWAIPAIPATTVMLFVQTTAPVGWTKSLAHNDKALRVVNGTAASGGFVAFSTAFARTQTDGCALTIAEMPTHSHGIPISGTSGFSAGASMSSNGSPTATGTSDSAGGGASHFHNMDIRVQYVDVIIATKD
jgi:hypothetical protein